MTEDRKRELVASPVTLNGEPARLCGAGLAWAYVEQIGSGLGCQWSWKAAERIVAAGGAFRSC